MTDGELAGIRERLKGHIWDMVMNETARSDRDALFAEVDRLRAILSQPSVPGAPLSQEQLNEYRRIRNHPGIWADREVNEMLDYIDYLQGPICDALVLGEMEQYRLGFEVGRNARLEEAATKMVDMGHEGLAQRIDDLKRN